MISAKDTITHEKKKNADTNLAWTLNLWQHSYLQQLRLLS